MGFWRSLAGISRVEITSASIADMLTTVNNRGITLFNIVYVDDLHITGSIYQFELKALENCLMRHGDAIKVIQNRGLYWTIQNLRHRPILVVGVIVFMLTALYLPTRVFFVRVEGNQKIPTQLIVEKAELCGIGFGASRRAVRSEKMKNAILSAIPELQWAGVNTAGCVAVISVRERSVASAQNKPQIGSSIVAARDGVIKEMTVLKGNPLCTVGQAVKKGQILVSGYTDCGLLIKTTESDAEIAAQTQRTLQAITPTNYIIRGKKTAEETRYRLRIGKNIINFCKDSGISDTTCVKMYEEQYIVLPGEFQLPVAVITEHQVYFEQYEAQDADTYDYNWMTESSDIYLQSQMLAGEIMHSDRVSHTQEGLYKLTSSYSCVEMIGMIRNEEIVEGNGKRD